MAFAASLSNQSLKSLRSCFASGAGLPFADFLVALARTHSLQLITATSGSIRVVGLHRLLYTCVV